MLKVFLSIGRQISVLSVIVLITSCERDEPMIETIDSYPVIVIEQNEIDVNEDNITDFSFEILYIGTQDEPMSAMAVKLKIRPYNNLLLQNINDGPLPFTDGQMIQGDMGTMLMWGNNGADIVGKNWHSENGWDTDWDGNWVDVSNKYLPFALNVNDGIYYGWLEMSIVTDMNTCFVEIHDYNYNENAGEFIIAGE